MSAIQTVLVLCVFGCSLTAATHAVAEPPVAKKAEPRLESKTDLGEPEAVAKERARLLFEKGVTAYRDGRFYDAVDIFLETNRLYPDPKLSYNVGRAMEGLGNQPGALRYYREYLRRLPDAPDLQEVLGHVHQLEQALSQKGLQQLTIISTPDGATVKLDGQAVGVTPWTGESFAGKHRVVLEVAGYHRYEGVVELDPHRARDLTFELARVVEESPANANAARTTARPEPQLSVFTLTALATGVALLGTALAAQVASNDAPGISRTAAFFAGSGAGITAVGGLMLYFDLSPSTSAAHAHGMTWSTAPLEHGMSH